jgi:hypothetical protein
MPSDGGYCRQCYIEDGEVIVKAVKGIERDIKDLLRYAQAS